MQFMSGSIVFLLSQYFEAVSGDPKCTKCQSCYNSFIRFNSPTNDETDTSWPLQVNRGSCCLWLCRGQFYVFQFMSKQGSGERVCYFQSPERSKFACVVQDVTRQHCSNSKRKKTAWGGGCQSNCSPRRRVTESARGSPVPSPPWLGVYTEPGLHSSRIKMSNAKLFLTSIFC